METVLKTVLVFMASVGSNPTPSASLKLDWTEECLPELPQNGGSFCGIADRILIESRFSS